jgi:hypothetical protein
VTANAGYSTISVLINALDWTDPESPVSGSPFVDLGNEALPNTPSLPSDMVDINGGIQSFVVTELPDSRIADPVRGSENHRYPGSDLNARHQTAAMDSVLPLGSLEDVFPTPTWPAAARKAPFGMASCGQTLEVR